MKSIRIGAVIAANRRKRGITQEELADFLGVSKPAVSKWESEQSYPDITLLPQLAAYFDLSIDELMNYTPQMPPDKIRDTYLKYRDAFTRNPYDAVIDEIDETVRQYFACWPLLFAMGQLILNHSSLAGGAEASMHAIQKAQTLFCRIIDQSNDPSLIRQSVHVQAACHLAKGESAEAIDLLTPYFEQSCSTELLLAKAYGLRGDEVRAIELLQASMFQNLIAFFGAVPDLLALCAKDPIKLEESVEAVLGLSIAAKLDELHPAVCLAVLLSASAAYTALGNGDRALSLMEDFSSLLSKTKSFALHNTTFFDRLDPFFATLNLGSSPPQDDDVIRRSLVDVALSHPAYEPLRSLPGYGAIALHLAKLKEG